jgi:uncharacterized protein
MNSPNGGRSAQEMSRIFLRPLGSPMPLGMIALAGASLMLTAYQLSWLPTTEGHAVAAVLLAFPVPMLYLAAVFGFLGRDGAGGTGMALLGSCWLVTGVLTLLSPPGSRSAVLGLFLYFACAAVLIPATAAIFGKVVASVAFVLAAARFAVAGVYEYHGGLAWKHASGWIGLALCVAALYAGLAFEIEDIRHHTVLPVLRWGSGRRAMEGDAEAESRHVEQEAGVREQL